MITSEVVEKLKSLKEALHKALVGQETLVNLLLTGFFTGGHVLLQGVPGLGKTLASKALGRIFGGSFKRIQFTPDLMPSDIVGTVIFNFQNQNFTVVKGPVFSNILLADEINRSPAKTQSALLQAMEERFVTIAGKDYDLQWPFFVVATQNPLEMEGTYPLPEAQLDRFMLQVLLDYPSEDEEGRIYDLVTQKQGTDPLTAVPEGLLDQESLKGIAAAVNEMVVDQRIVDYTRNLVRHTRKMPGIAFGSSPRGGIHLLKAARVWALLAERDYVLPEDIQDLAKPVLRHRILLEAESELEGMTPDFFIERLLSEVSVVR
jgi:MoxR-like ATPase